MSEYIGDKARFNRRRKKQALQRERIRELRKTLVTPSTAKSAKK